MAEFVFNNKVYTATKTLLFQVNYRRELRMSFDIRKKEKNEKAEKFVREMKERHEEARVALVKSQEEMKRQVDRNRKEAEEYRVGDKILISTKDFSKELIKRATKKLTEKFIEQVEGQKKIPLPPVEVASKKEYVVEEILDRQEKREKMKYLVK